MTQNLKKILEYFDLTQRVIFCRPLYNQQTIEKSFAFGTIITSPQLN